MKLSICAILRRAAAVRARRLPRLRRAARLHPRRAGADDARAARRRHASTPASRPDERWRRCVNAEAAGCNWLVPAASAEDPRCPACRLNRNLADMHGAEEPSRSGGCSNAPSGGCSTRCCASALPIASQKDGEARGLAFDFLEGSRGAPVMTGHANGLITINISEADSAERERQRVALGEPYRTLLGHMRHEAGHYYWDLLVARRRPASTRAGRSSATRRESYGEALEALLRARPEAGLGGRLRQRLRDDAPLGGLRRDLDPLSAHGRHARHRRELRALGQPQGRRGSARTPR